MQAATINVPNQVRDEFLSTILTLKLVKADALQLIEESELYTSYRLEADNTTEAITVCTRLNTVINDIEQDMRLYGC